MENNIYSARLDCNIKIIIHEESSELTDNIDFYTNTIYIQKSDEFTMNLFLFRALVRLFGYKCGLGRNVVITLPKGDLINFIAAYLNEIKEIIDTVIENFIKYQYIEEE